MQEGTFLFIQIQKSLSKYKTGKDKGIYVVIKGNETEPTLNATGSVRSKSGSYGAGTMVGPWNRDTRVIAFLSAFLTLTVN